MKTLDDLEASGWRILTSGEGKDRGEAGMRYRFVTAFILTKGTRYRSVVVETWGRYQGQEVDKHYIIGRGTSADDAIAAARVDALAVGVTPQLLVAALNEAAVTAEDIEEDERPTLPGAVPRLRRPDQSPP